MRSKLPTCVSQLAEFITNQQAHASLKLGMRSVVEGIPVSDRDSVILAIYVDICTDAVWLKELSIAEIQELVSCIFIDDFSKSKNKPMLPLTIRHCTMAHHLRLEQDKNWKRVAELSLESLRGGKYAPSLSDIIEDRSITWDANRLNRLVHNAINPNSKRNNASLKHSLVCPYCAISMQIDQVFSKTEVRCPSCGQSFNVQP
jgi:hypothetical protein